jgi:hypothetical protein
MCPWGRTIETEAGLKPQAGLALFFSRDNYLGWYRGLPDWGLGRVCVRTKKKPQISPLRYAPVEMTRLWQLKLLSLSRKRGTLSSNKFVIPTGAQRSGEICGFFLVLTHTKGVPQWLKPCPSARDSFPSRLENPVFGRTVAARLKPYPSSSVIDCWIEWRVGQARDRCVEITCL